MIDDSNYITEPNSGCWIWTGTLLATGYGYKKGGDLAHRASYFQYKGEIFDGLEIDHLCRNKTCINPDHLEAVTHAVNSRRAMQKDTCVNGHSLIGNNMISLSGDRKFQKRCKQCHRERMRKYRLPKTPG